VLSIGGAVGLILLLWFFCPFIGLAVGSTKGRATEGFFLGLLLSGLGVLIVAVMNPTSPAQARREVEVAKAVRELSGARQCPWCAERIQPAARLCRYCRHDVEPTAPLDAHPSETRHSLG